MKGNILLLGLLAGAVLSVVMIVNISICYTSGDFDGSMLLGYGSMIVAFSLVFLGIRNFRDKQNGGFITFGHAFRIGLTISVIASACYVVAWLIDYYVFIPDFAEKYATYTLAKAREAGTPQIEINKLQSGMESFKTMYKNPLMVVFMTLGEVLPIGLVITLLSALILKRPVTTR